MFMKPLLLHSSSRTTNNNKSRVLHIELGRTVRGKGVAFKITETLTKHFVQLGLDESSIISSGSGQI